MHGRRYGATAGTGTSAHGVVPAGYLGGNVVTIVGLERPHLTLWVGRSRGRAIGQPGAWPVGVDERGRLRYTVHPWGNTVSS